MKDCHVVSEFSIHATPLAILKALNGAPHLERQWAPNKRVLFRRDAIYGRRETAVNVMKCRDHQQTPSRHHVLHGMYHQLEKEPSTVRSRKINGIVLT